MFLGKKELGAKGSLSPSSFTGGEWTDQGPAMTAPYFETPNIPLGQRNFYPFTWESLAAINARKLERGAGRKAADDQQVSFFSCIHTL